MPLVAAMVGAVTRKAKTITGGADSQALLKTGKATGGK